MELTLCHCHQSSVEEDRVGPQVLCAPSAGEWAEIAAHTDRASTQFLRRNCSDSPSLVPLSEFSLSFLSGPLDHSLWRAVEEDEFGIHVFLQVQLPRLSDQEDVGAQLEDAVHVGQLLEHDGVGDAAKKLAHELSDDQNHRGIQAHDPRQERERGNETMYSTECGFLSLFLFFHSSQHIT